MPPWTHADMPSQAGRVAIVTGATSGIGFAAARALAAAGGRVILAARNPARGAAALAAIRAGQPQAEVRFALLDLGSLASIRAFATATIAALPAVDILVNNAGLMRLPAREITEDGFERQFGTNHLGHFALTALLWPLLAAAGPATGAPARVVTVASVAHRRGRLNFADLNAAAGYRPVRAYTQSKLANLVFALELQRRIAGSAAAAALAPISVAAHPGYTATALYRTGRDGSGSGLVTHLGDRAFRAFGMPPWQGALPILYAATAPGVAGGSYVGPDGFREGWGFPAPARIAPQAADPESGRRLWAASEALTGMRFVP